MGGDASFPRGAHPILSGVDFNRIKGETNSTLVDHIWKQKLVRCLIINEEKKLILFLRVHTYGITSQA